MIYLTAEELLYVAERAAGSELVVRDHGLLESASSRPQSSWYSLDTYPTLEEKSAALVHSLVNNHALVDGNKRLGLAGLFTFLGVNGFALKWTNDEAFEFIMEIADGQLAELPEIAARVKLAMVPLPALNL